MEVLVRAKPVQISACIRIIGYIFSRFILICRIITLILRTLKHENNKKLLNKFFFYQKQQLINHTKVTSNGIRSYPFVSRLLLIHKKKEK